MYVLLGRWRCRACGTSLTQVAVAGGCHGVQHTDTGITYSFAVLGMYLLPDAPDDTDLEKQLDEGQIYSMRTFLAAMFCLLQVSC